MDRSGSAYGRALLERWWDWIVSTSGNSAETTTRFIDIVRRRWRDRGYDITTVLTNGGEFIGRTFTERLDRLGITHQRIPPRSPNHNAVVERFHQTMLEECWRPAFHRQLFTSIHQLQTQANA